MPGGDRLMKLLGRAGIAGSAAGQTASASGAAAHVFGSHRVSNDELLRETGFHSVQDLQDRFWSAGPRLLNPYAWRSHGPAVDSSWPAGEWNPSPDHAPSPLYWRPAGQADGSAPTTLARQAGQLGTLRKGGLSQLPALARWSRETGEMAGAGLAVQWFHSFDQFNPEGSNPHWSSAEIVSCRLINLILALDAIGPRPEMRDALPRWLASILEHRNALAAGREQYGEAMDALEQAVCALALRLTRALLQQGDIRTAEEQQESWLLDWRLWRDHPALMHSALRIGLYNRWRDTLGERDPPPPRHLVELAQTLRSLTDHRGWLICQGWFPLAPLPGFGSAHPLDFRSTAALCAGWLHDPLMELRGIPADSWEGLALDGGQVRSPPGEAELRRRIVVAKPTEGPPDLQTMNLALISATGSHAGGTAAPRPSRFSQRGDVDFPGAPPALVADGAPAWPRGVRREEVEFRACRVTRWSPPAASNPAANRGLAALLQPRPDASPQPSRWRVEIRGGIGLVLDQSPKTARAVMECWLPLGADLRVESAGPQLIHAVSDQGRWDLYSAGWGNYQAVVSGQENPPLGWDWRWRSGSGDLSPAAWVHRVVQAQGPWTGVNCFCPRDAAVPWTFASATRSQLAGLAELIRVERGEDVYTIGFRFDAATVLTGASGMVCDADWFMVHQGQGRLRSAAMWNGKVLRIGEETIFEVKDNQIATVEAVCAHGLVDLHCAEPGRKVRIARLADKFVTPAGAGAEWGHRQQSIMLAT
ncbi:MAG: hypothetical protein GMKNLPBB_01460 [Myxococcota bacterium]|nr:hypothetical protein [Myxococcota bacterium]